MTEARKLREALDPPAMDVIYLLNHAERADDAGDDSALVFQKGRLRSDLIAKWNRTDWRKPHWPDRRPLVIPNACYTAEIVSSSLGGFIE